MKKSVILIYIALCASSLTMTGQEVSIAAGFDTTKILIGDQINFTIRVEQPVGLKLKLPLFRDTINKHIEILSGPVIDTSTLSDNRIKISEKYLVTSFDSGTYRVSPVFAEKNDPGGLKRFYSDYSFLEVARVKLAPPDTSLKIFDIAAPYKAPLTLGELLPWILLLIVTTLAVWLGIRLIKKYRKREREEVIPILAEPAHVTAFRELERLRGEKLWQNGETKKYYTRLTDIIRQYLENRFMVYSMELTTSETLEALVRSGFKKDDSYNRIKSILNGADLVKFAKYKPDPVENDLSFSNAWDFVSATKAVEVVEMKDGIKTDGEGKEL